MSDKENNDGCLEGIFALILTLAVLWIGVTAFDFLARQSDDLCEKVNVCTEWRWRPDKGEQ